MLTRILEVAIVFLGIGLPSVSSALWREAVEYARFGNEPLLLDGDVPQPPGPFPLAVLVHGGAFIKGDRRADVVPLLSPLIQAGFGVATVDYRLAPAHPFPAAVEDVEESLRFLFSHASEYKIDATKVAL